MGKRNEALQRVADVLVGDWKVTMTNAWFWEDPADVVEGSATVAWLDGAFLIMRWYFGDVPEAVWVLGRSDAHDAFVALSYDERGVLRVFDMTFTGVGGEWLRRPGGAGLSVLRRAYRRGEVPGGGGG